VVISYRFMGEYQSHLVGSRNLLDSWLLKEITSTHFVITHKRAVLINFVLEAWTHTECLICSLSLWSINEVGGQVFSFVRIRVNENAVLNVPTYGVSPFWSSSHQSILEIKFPKFSTHIQLTKMGINYEWGHDVWSFTASARQDGN